MSDAPLEEMLTTNLAWHILGILVVAATVFITIKHDEVVAVSRIMISSSSQSLMMVSRNYGRSP